MKGFSKDTVSASEALESMSAADQMAWAQATCVAGGPG